LQTEPLFEFSSKGFLLGVTEIIEMPEFFLRFAKLAAQFLPVLAIRGNRKHWNKHLANFFPCTCRDSNKRQ
jgi:hypothetical protein